VNSRHLQKSAFKLDIIRVSGSLLEMSKEKSGRKSAIELFIG
jgi:hypothetical protein